MEGVQGYMKSRRELGEGTGRVGKGHWNVWEHAKDQMYLWNLTQKTRKDFTLSSHPCLALSHSFSTAGCWPGFQPLRFSVYKSNIVGQMFWIFQGGTKMGTILCWKIEGKVKAWWRTYLTRVWKTCKSSAARLREGHSWQKEQCM